MRTTVDLPPGLHRRVRELAEESGQSLSRVVTELTARGLATYDRKDEARLGVSALSGLPTVRIGRAVTSAEVAAALDDE